MALLKRLRKSKDWLYRLCCALFEERGIQIQPPPKQRLRLIDSTLVKEPGKTGSQWRIHYSLQWPTLACDYFKITATEGNGTGESLQQFPLNRHDYVLADRGFCKATGIHFAVRNQAYIIVRLNQDSIRLQEESGSEFELVQKSTNNSKDWANWPMESLDSFRRQQPSASATVCDSKKSSSYCLGTEKNSNAEPAGDAHN